MKTNQLLTYGAIIATTGGLVGALIWKHNADHEQIKTAYVTEQKAEIDRTTKNIESTFNDFYQGIRTMSLLPGVRTIDRYAKNFNPDSKSAMQQIYNNTFLNVTLSEVYILPKSIDPDSIDPVTHKNEEPVLTFDEFIVSKTTGIDAAQKEEEKKEIEEEEIFEYRLMKKQLAYLSSSFPTNATITGLDVPAITGEEVITCDNSEFTKAELNAHNDAPRKGIVLTVPRYDLAGNFAGAVSGVVRTNILKKLFPANFYGLVNKTNSWKIVDAPIQEWTDSTRYFESGKTNPDLIISQVRDLNIKDTSPWQLWVAKSNSDFFNRHDVQQANAILYAGIAVSLLLGSLLTFGAWSSFTNQARLEQKVEEKTAALSERNVQMALILNNAEEGFLTVNLDGTMADERSAIVATWFGVSNRNTKFWDYIAAGKPNQIALFRAGWDQLIEDIFPFEMSADQLPKIVMKDEQSLSIKFKAVNDATGKLFKVLVMITDVTALVEAAKRELQQRELVAVFQTFSADRNGFKQFFQDAKGLIQRIHQRRTQASKDIDFREVHTLKGNASQFGMLSVAEICHQIETELSEAGRPLTDSEREQLKSAWEGAAESLKDFVADAESNNLVIDPQEFAQVLHKMKSIQGADLIAEQIASWSLESTTVPFKRLGEQVKTLCQRLGKGNVELVIQDHGVRLDADKYRDIWMNATHLVRNIADHAFEMPEERVKLGKGAPRIIFSSQSMATEVVLTFSDNGRGIDWKKLKDVATKKGLPSATQLDLEAAIFADGVSTADSVTSTSGRGVGMSALLAGVKSLGGNITIQSKEGLGTTFTIVLPKSPVKSVKAA